MTDRTLFDVGKTVSTACPVPGCGAIRLPGQTTVPTCQTDLDRATQGWTSNRPKNCLNQWDSTAPFPQGY